MTMPAAVMLYGIPNCDTVKKARRWLDARGIAYDFHDYKKAGVPEAALRSWVEREGWERLLNRKGTTFRKLDAAATADLDAGRAVALMLAHSSTIKRPVLAYAADGLLIGFDEEAWAAALA